MSHRSLLTRRRIIFLALVFLVFATAFYAYQIEPFHIEVTRHQISAPLHSPIKIAHLSDLHTYGIGRRERKMLGILEQEKPDLIVITGDLISAADGLEGCLEVLRHMKAPLGVWIVLGNHENWTSQSVRTAYGTFRDYYESGGANFLSNSNKRIRDDLWLIGLDDPMTGKPDIDTARLGVPENAYTICLFHSPAYFDKAAEKCDLVLAGHSHGGQVRVPFMKPLWLPKECNNYDEGWFERNGSKMYVSRGIGTSVFPVRFNCRPEIAIITLG
jgi:predicted MPP superfamily phosphohydrolase